MSCERYQDRFSDHLEGALAPAAARRLEAHLDACAGCRGLHAELEELLFDLPLCAEPLPDGLGARLAARTPCRRPEAAWIAWRRAAAWAFVFLAAWWQLAGGAVTSFAAEEIVPAASAAVADVKESAARQAVSGEGILGRLERARGGLATLRRSVDDALFEAGSAPAPSPQSVP